MAAELRRTPTRHYKFTFCFVGFFIQRSKSSYYEATYRIHTKEIISETGIRLRSKIRL